LNELAGVVASLFVPSLAAAAAIASGAGTV